VTNVLIRNTRIDDAEQLCSLSREIYPLSPPWSRDQLQSHLSVFPEGQFVAIDSDSGRICGMASSLIVFWDDYDSSASWKDFTAGGYFTNHDPSQGRTLYAAEVMVSPAMQGRGIGKKLYAARTDLIREKGLLRIRAGARLRGYSKYSSGMSPGEYVMRVVLGEIGDPTLSFQLRQGFQAIGVVSQYLRHDPESLGHAAIIEWLNPDVADSKDYERQKEFLSQLKRAFRSPSDSLTAQNSAQS